MSTGGTTKKRDNSFRKPLHFVEAFLFLGEKFIRRMGEPRWDHKKRDNSFRKPLHFVEAFLFWARSLSAGCGSPGGTMNT